MKIIIRKKDRILNQDAFLILLTDFIKDTAAGRRTKSNGSLISHSTVENYMHMKRLVHNFSKQSTFEIKLYLVNNLNQAEKENAHKYYRKFYIAFTSYMYDDLNYFDNYVGNVVKCLKAFFNYLIKERSIEIGNYHRLFYVPNEEIPIIALNREQLNYVINNAKFKRKVKENELEVIRDVFVFGCTVALRISDLLTLSPKNLVIRDNKYYIQVKSQKTKKNTVIKLPDYCVTILKKYKGKQETLLPSCSLFSFNSKLKKMATLFPDNFELVKTRDKRGKQIVIYKNPILKTHYKLSDHMSSHVMRRTGITTMLNLGMPEYMVRRISGHTANSKEFFRYVQLSQNLVDKETDRVFEQLAMK